MPLYFEDFTVGQVDEFGAYRVTRQEVIDFATKYDPQPFHLDDEAAEQSLFGKLCASGWHTCAMMMRMLVDHLTANDAASLGSPGVDKVRWVKPVYPGDVLRMRLTVTGAQPSTKLPGVGKVSSSYEILNQRDEAVMTMQGVAFFRCRPT